MSGTKQQGLFSRCCDVMYGWNLAFDTSQLSELAKMEAPFFIGESEASASSPTKIVSQPSPWLQPLSGARTGHSERAAIVFFQPARIKRTPWLKNNAKGKGRFLREES